MRHLSAHFQRPDENQICHLPAKNQHITKLVIGQHIRQYPEKFANITSALQLTSKTAIFQHHQLHSTKPTLPNVRSTRTLPAPSAPPRKSACCQHTLRQKSPSASILPTRTLPAPPAPPENYHLPARSQPTNCASAVSTLCQLFANIKIPLAICASSSPAHNSPASTASTSHNQSAILPTTRPCQHCQHHLENQHVANTRSAKNHHLPAFCQHELCQHRQHHPKITICQHVRSPRTVPAPSAPYASFLPTSKYHLPSAPAARQHTIALPAPPAHRITSQQFCQPHDLASTASTTSKIATPQKNQTLSCDRKKNHQHSLASNGSSFLAARLSRIRHTMSNFISWP
jgi:hypothetical protein